MGQKSYFANPNSPFLENVIFNSDKKNKKRKKYIHSNNNKYIYAKIDPPLANSLPWWVY